VDNAIEGRVCLITGATAGLGLATAKALATQGATLLLVGRNPRKTNAVVNHLRRTTKNPRIEPLIADLSVQAEVRALAAEVLRRHPALHVLINNAGALFLRRQTSRDGLEMTLALNHLAYFLLTTLLLDRLKQSAPARIIIVASHAHEGAEIAWDDLQGERAYDGRRAYAQSKLMNLLFTYELARQLQGSGVSANALDPGSVETDLGRNNDGWLWHRAKRLGRRVLGRARLTPEAGAQTIVYLATAAEVAGVSGKYFVRNTVVPSSPASYDTAAARRLWALSLTLTGMAR
jgi:NAD(P)-dependent dehydrogenase (short-subunit alcohol dehydrogenase family)